MSELPRIVNENPITVPAVEAQSYPDYYLTDLVVSTGATALNQSVTVSFHPYNYETKALAPLNFDFCQQRKVIHNINLWEEAARSTLFAQAMGAVIMYATLKLQEDTLLNKITQLRAPFDTEIPEEIQTAMDNVNVQLAEIRTQMGVN